MKKCAILSVGQEILFGYTLDTNGSFFCNELRRLGIEVLQMQTVNDDLTSIVEALQSVSLKVDIILVTGGLGPTPDDLTRAAIAQAAGVELKLDDGLVAEISKYFDSLNISMSESNKVQAMLPETAEPLYNNCGTAPGVKCKVGKATVYAMPGVPSEMKAMFNESVKPDLNVSGKEFDYYVKLFHMCGLGESIVGEYLRKLSKEYPNLEIGTTVDHWIVTVRVSGAEVELATKVSRMVANEFKGYIFGEDGCRLEEVIVALLTEKKQTLALAESCTGGIIASEIVGVSGASIVFLEGIVSYSNQAKIKRLGVSAQTVEKFGAVSARCALEMAQGARKTSGADYALSVTGIAGPEGGTVEKPVGTVFLAVSTPEKNYVFRRNFPKSARNTARLFTSHYCMDILRRAICNLPLPEEACLEE